MMKSPRTLGQMAATLRDTRRDLLVTAAMVTGLAITSPAATAKRKPGKKKKRKPCPPGVDQLRVAFSCPTLVDAFYVSGDGVIRFGQVFIPARSGKLRALIVAIDVFNPDLAGDFLVQLVRTNDGMVPSAAAVDVLAAVTVPKGDVIAGRSILFAAFPSAPQLTQGTAYAFALRLPAPVDPEVSSGVAVRMANTKCGSIACFEPTPGSFVPLPPGGFGYQFSVLVG
ncbi:MAG: hypothetical protein U0031_02795 [Thermomicrobiales bacterium]